VKTATVKEVHVIAPEGGRCTFDDHEISTEPGQTVRFVNDTDRRVRISLSNQKILDSEPFYLKKKGDTKELKVKDYVKKVSCMVEETEASGAAVMITAMPTIIINRD